MICQFKKLIYPRDAALADGSYMIALYRPCEQIKDAGGRLVSEVKAVGYCLPTADNLRYDIKGRWSKSTKHGVQFEVETYKEIIIPTKEGIIAYLTSGQIKGIGPKTAEKDICCFRQQDAGYAGFRAAKTTHDPWYQYKQAQKNLRFLLGFPRRP